MNITVSSNRPNFDNDYFNEYNGHNDRNRVPRSQSSQTFKNQKKESPFSQPYIPNKQQELASPKPVFNPQKEDYKQKDKQATQFDPRRNSNEGPRHGSGRRNEFYRAEDSRKGVSRSKSGMVGKIIQVGQKFQEPPPPHQQQNKGSDFNQPYIPNSHLIDDQTQVQAKVPQEQADHVRGKKTKGSSWHPETVNQSSSSEKIYRPRYEGGDRTRFDGAHQNDGSRGRSNYGSKGKGQSPKRPAAGGIL